jgi:perosamine synthetase
MKAYRERLTITDMIKLAKPVISEAVIQEVAEVIRSGNLVQGPRVGQFEEALRDYLDIEHVAVVSSGTAALHLSLMALSIKNGDEVIVPAFTFPAPANAVENVGAKPVFVDISLADFCIDPSRIEDVITERTKAIIVVHEFGQAAELEKIVEIAKRRDLHLIEDAACAIGAQWKNRPVGSFGILGCFSFHPRKVITTGEGGAITTGDASLAQRIRALRNHGLSAPGTSEFTYAGLNYRMTDFQAVMGHGQLMHVEEEIAARIKQAEQYRGSLSDCGWLRTPETLENRRHIYQTFHVLLDDAMDRDRLIRHLKEQGVETILGAQALHILPYYKTKYGYAPSDYPQALRAFRQGLALPMGSHVTGDNIDTICDRLRHIHRSLSD